MHFSVPKRRRKNRPVGASFSSHLETKIEIVEPEKTALYHAQRAENIVFAKTSNKNIFGRGFTVISGEWYHLWSSHRLALLTCDHMRTIFSTLTGRNTFFKIHQKFKSTYIRPPTAQHCAYVRGEPTVQDIILTVLPPVHVLRSMVSPRSPVLTLLSYLLRM